MISAVVAVEPVKEAAVLAIVVVAATDGGKMAADVDVATNASHMRTTLILLTSTGILLRTSGNASGLCARMSYSYETAVVVNMNRTTIGVSATNTKSNDSANTTNAPADQSVMSKISERGSQNGRGFGRGAYKT